jgi:hypothetical protein
MGKLKMIARIVLKQCCSIEVDGGFMEFEQSKHTKEFLMANVDVAFELAEKSEDFAVSSLADHIDILSLKNNGGWTVATVANTLATFQPQWLSSDAVKNTDILKLSDKFGCTVAHDLAIFQPQWLNSAESKNLDILRLTDRYGWTVAHHLARNQPQWLNSAESRKLDILTMKDEDGMSVAGILVKDQIESINHVPLFHKTVLSLDENGKLLAEHISDEYGNSHGMDVSVMSMKMINQGAAYKHSTSLPLKVGENILKQAKAIADDSVELLVTLKQLLAIYSTIHHQVEKMKPLSATKSLKKWISILAHAEGLVENHLNAHPVLFDIDHTIDIFCEPGDALLKHLASERVLRKNSFLANEIEPIEPEIAAGKGLH